jgi:hypothetical protein
MMLQVLEAVAHCRAHYFPRRSKGSRQLGRADQVTKEHRQLPPLGFRRPR